ncbi:MAG: hypothetical protein RLZZ502_951 [Pseudomonadota bacterium]
MCGISGLLDGKRRLKHIDELAKAMALRMQHRGPDGADEWVDHAAGVALAHRRLAIVDLSAAGKQPMASSCGRYVVSYNGEIYNHAELRAELDAVASPQWRGHSDTEVMLNAFSTWGVTNSLAKMTGMWAIALWDKKEHTLTLIRDRMGEKPLYYGYVGGVFAFASELKCLHAIPNADLRIHAEAVPLFCRTSYIPAPLSIYQNIFKLSPGSSLTLSCADAAAGHLPEPQVYWSFRQVAEHGQGSFKGSPEDAVNELERLLQRSIARQMMADVPVGAFLSGGVDSSAVVALMQAQSPGKVKSFSIGFSEKAYDEAPYARAVAAHLGTAHTELYVSPEEAMAVIPRLAHIYDEPFADSSQIPTFLVSQMTRAHVTVSLSGDAGDELFNGYTRYAYSAKLMQRMRPLPLTARQTLGRLMQAIPDGLWSSALALPHFLAPATVKRLLTANKVKQFAAMLRDSDPAGLYARFISNSDPLSLARCPEPMSLIRHYEQWPKVSPYVEQIAALDALTYLPDDILCKVDRAAMAVSLETRVPMLDHELVAFAFSLPAHYKWREGQSKWPLRSLLYRHVPRALIERPKQGFGVPLGDWFKGPLRDWVESLLPASDSPYWHSTKVRQLWQEHLDSKDNHAYRLWNVLMFEAWQREYSAS